MGSNTFLKDCDSFGYIVQADTTTAVYRGIPRHPAQRITIRAFGATCGNVATEIHFMNVITTTDLTSPVATGTATIVVNDNNCGGDGVGNPTTVAVGDWIAVMLNNGATHFAQVHSITSSTIRLTNCLTFAAGVATTNTIYGLGAYTDAQIGYNMTVATQNTKELEGGIFYGKEKGYPMIVYAQASAETALISIDYLTIDYINS